MTEASKSNRLRFGEFAADLASGELFRHGTKVPLQDKPFRILALLMQNPKELVSRHEIIRTIWPDTFVEGDLCLNVAIRRLRSALNDDPSHARFIETVGSHGYRLLSSVHGSVASEEVISNRGHPRVAIFPLKTFMRAESGTFGPALTDLLITQLRQMNPPFVVVTPEFTTERAHKGRGTLSLCRHASVDYALVGAVSEARGEVRVIVRLLDCRARACIWAQSYTKSNANLFAVQEEISRAIASMVVESLPGAQHPDHLSYVPTTAREKYVQGCYCLSKLTEAGTERSIPFFDEAVRECPRFALAWAAEANAYCVLARLGVLPSRKAFPKLKTAADNAIQIEDLAQARTARAYYQLLYQHDCNAAEADLVRALAIDPGDSLARGGYAQLLMAMGRRDEAVAMMRRACDLDPFSSYTGVMLGWVLYYAQCHDEALAQLDRAMQLDPSLWVGQITKGMVLEEMGRLEESIAQYQLAIERSENSALARAHLACSFAKNGDRTRATEILKALLRLRQRRYFSAYLIASVQISLHEHSQALSWLETATQERCAWIVFLAVDPRFCSLHTDSRFRKLVESIIPPRAKSSEASSTV